MHEVTENLELLKPLSIDSTDAEQIFRMRERNNGLPAKEATWLNRAFAEHEAISAAETEFFAELKRRLA